jgi:hypothetical protein
MPAKAVIYAELPIMLACCCRDIGYPGDKLLLFPYQSAKRLVAATMCSASSVDIPGLASTTSSLLGQARASSTR